MMKSNLNYESVTTFKKLKSPLQESKLKTSSCKLPLFSRLTHLSSNVRVGQAGNPKSSIKDNAISFMLIMVVKVIFTEINFLGGKYPGAIVRRIILGGNFPGAIIQEKFSFLSFITNTALKLLKIFNLALLIH